MKSLFNGANYNPTELLKVCQVNSLSFLSRIQYANRILALCLSERDANKLRNELDGIIQELNTISIGRSLITLNDIATTGQEFQGNADGLDALTYHLSADTCSRAIHALQSVLTRFEQKGK